MLHRIRQVLLRAWLQNIWYRRRWASRIWRDDRRFAVKMAQSRPLGGACHKENRKPRCRGIWCLYTLRKRNFQACPLSRIRNDSYVERWRIPRFWYCVEGSCGAWPENRDYVLVATCQRGKNPPSVYLEKGHSIYNFLSRYTYYVVGVGLLEGTTIEKIERDWDAYTFDINNPQNKLAAPNEKIKGGGFCLWSDCPAGETEEEVFEHLTPLIKLCGEKLLGK